MKYSGKIHIVYDGMWGSCGKGKVVGELALDPRLKIDLCVNNNAPNAGHSFVFNDGRKVVTKHIPIGFVNPNIKYLVIGESAVIDYDRLIFEMNEYKDLLAGRKIYIAGSAAVISESNKQYEIENIKSGSTYSGAGSALIDKIKRINPLVRNDPRFKELESQGLIKIVSSKTFFPLLYCGKAGFNGNENILVEVSQGDALSFNGNSYPYTTSRDCTPAQALKDIHATDYSDRVTKYCVFRPYPIRINNQGKAGYVYTGDFEGAKEIDWETVCARAGLNAEEIKQREFTTVTKRLRRVAEFSIKQFAEMLLDTRPDECYLNFAEYINAKVEGISNTNLKQIQTIFENLESNNENSQNANDINDKEQALEHILNYITSMENFFNNLFGSSILNITKIGTGAKECEVIDRQNLKYLSSQEITLPTPFDYADKNNLPNFSI